VKSPASFSALDDVGLLLRAADDLARAGWTSAAEAVFQFAIKDSPSPVVRRHYARFLLQVERFTVAERILTELLESDCPHSAGVTRAGILSDLVVVYRAQGNHNRAARTQQLSVLSRWWCGCSRPCRHDSGGQSCDRLRKTR